MRHYQELFSFIPVPAAVFLCCGALLLAASLFFLFRYPNARLNYLLLFAATAVFSTGFVFMDPYLHPWDEQFHALVAKNMADGNPFHPVLLDGCATLGHRDWTNNATWLHKQPLFLWQMALSVKIFGANLFAVRLPSVLLHACSTVLVLSVAKRYLSYFFAVLAAVLFGFSGLLNDYVSGAMGMDHNDVAFVFYVTASLWTWLKYRETRALKWAVLTGLFSGGAVLCKWLVGLLVFAGWGLIVTVYERNRTAWKHLLIALGTTVLIAMPWQIWCMVSFPREFTFEAGYNSLHFFRALEQHSGDTLFYWHGMKAIYGGGELMRVIVLAGLILGWITAFRKRDRKWLFAAATFTLVYLFFTAAATKLPGYVLIVSGFGFIFLLFPIDLLARYIRSGRRDLPGRWLLPFIVVIVLLLHFNPKGVIDRHYYRAPDQIDVWKRDLAHGAALIRKDRSGRCIVITGESGVVVPALRFMTGREIYAAGTRTCETCTVVDLQDKRPPIRSAN